MPPRPLVRLRVGGDSYDGLVGSFCWPVMDPTGQADEICIDALFVEPADVISVTAQEVINVEIEAHEQPLHLGGSIFQSADGVELQSFTLRPGLEGSFAVPNLPAGVYVLHLSGQWQEGSLNYALALKIG